MAEEVRIRNDQAAVSKQLYTTNFEVISQHGRKRPFLIGVAGGTCCGKVLLGGSVTTGFRLVCKEMLTALSTISPLSVDTTVCSKREIKIKQKSEVCRKILKDLGQVNIESQMRKVIILSQDSFYRDLDESESAQADAGNFNFDHPGAFDDNLCLKTLKSLIKGEQAVIQEYSFKMHSREAELRTVHPADVIIFEGILVLYNKEIRKLLDMKIFVDTDSDTRLARRVLRDIVEHGRDIDNVLNQYTRFVKPAFEDFTLPTKKYADVIIPRGADNTVAIDLIVQHIKDLLNEKCSDSSKKRTRHQSESGVISSKIRPH